jgi:RNA polymerase sigma factor (sigma-70 family)
MKSSPSVKASVGVLNGSDLPIVGIFDNVEPHFPPANAAECSGDCEGCPASIHGQTGVARPATAHSNVVSIRTGTPSITEDEWLVKECLQGSQEAWEKLIDKYKRLVYSIPFKYGATPEDASDIFQSVCIELFNSLSKLRNVQSLRSWLITVTIHQSLHWKKKRGHNVELDAMEPEMIEEIAVAPEVLENLQQEQSLREAISQLPPRCAELLQLLFLEQPPLPYTEVARHLGLATGSIGFIRGRCLDKLRKILLELGYR